MNEALISWISKTEKPEEMAIFRLIALCNVVSKVITKIIANRIKPLISKLVSKNQANFIPNRQASDNIVVVQEMIRSLKWRTRKKDAIVVKVDLEKAYDRIQWEFLEKAIETVGLSPSIFKLIIFCVTLTKL